MITDLKSAIAADDRSTRPSESGIVSANRPLEERLRECEQLYQGLFEQAPVACHELDRDGIIVRVNEAECTLLGFEPRNGRLICSVLIRHANTP